MNGHAYHQTKNSLNGLKQLSNFGNKSLNANYHIFWTEKYLNFGDQLRCAVHNASCLMSSPFISVKLEASYTGSAHSALLDLLVSVFMGLNFKVVLSSTAIEI